MGIRILAGRIFTPSDPDGYLLVDEALARRYWPDGNDLGARFSMGGASFGNKTPFEIIGIASHVRVESTETPGGDELFLAYNRITPDYSPLAFVVRLEHERQLPALASLVRSLAPGAIVRTDLVDNRYNRLYGDVRLAASVTSGFGMLAFIVAMSGVYGLMAFLVTGRTREIGVRVALGAGPSEIRGMFLWSSARLVLAGGVLGIASAALVSRALESMLFGVTSSDPLASS